MKAPEIKNDANTPGGEHRIYVQITHLNPGAILKGKTYSESGEFLFEEYHVFTEKNISDLKEKGYVRIFYIPLEKTVTELAKKKGMDFMSRLMDAIKTGGAVDIPGLTKAVELIMEDILPGEIGTVELLALKDYNEYSYVHSINVSILSMLLAKKAGMKEDDVRDVGIGAMLHDVGKVNTPSDLIWKNDGDNDSERGIIREHPSFGYAMLKASGGVPETALNVVLKHHEHYDGSGYPRGIEEKEMEPHVRVVSICNYYDNLTSVVEGKSPLTPRDAVLRLMKLAGTVFSPVVVNGFVRGMTHHLIDTPLYPPGSVVLLSTGEMAQVVEIRKYSDTLPLVRILADSRGKKISRPIAVDLKQDEARTVARLVKAPG